MNKSDTELFPPGSCHPHRQGVICQITALIGALTGLLLAVPG